MTTAQQDVIDILTTDHQEVLELIGEIRSAEDGETRRELADTVIAELMRHSVAEEMYVYPAMKKHLTGGDEAVENDTKEHQQLEEIMKKLEASEAASPEFLQVLDELEEVLRDHISDEEDDQFPKLRSG